MHALSMMQPYAWLFTHGVLRIDDRSRGTAIRGPVAIHASRRFHAAYYDFLLANTDWPLPEPDAFEQGGVVGFSQLTDCLPPLARCTTYQPDMRRAHFGAPGFYGYVFERPQATPMVPYRGNLGFFHVPDAVFQPLLTA